MSAGERYGLSAHLADPEPKCKLGICDGGGSYVLKDSDGFEQMIYHDDGEFCATANRYGGCPGHPAEVACPCKTNRRNDG